MVGLESQWLEQRKAEVKSIKLISASEKSLDRMVSARASGVQRYSRNRPRSARYGEVTCTHWSSPSRPVPRSYVVDVNYFRVGKDFDQFQIPSLCFVFFA